MRHLVILPVLTLLVSACGDDDHLVPVYPWDDRPVDGQYRVTVTQMENTCAEDGPGPDETAVIDMFLRTDGLYDLRHGIWWLPLDFTVEAISREGGTVGHSKKWKSSYSDTVYFYSLRGRVTPDEMDLEVFFRGTDDCIERVRLVGKPRPLLDPSVLDGYYVLEMTSLGYICGDEPDTPGAPWNTMVTFSSPDPETVWMRLPDGTYLNPPPPAADGSVDWQGILYFPMGFFTLELDAELKGLYGPADVDLILAYGFPEEMGGDPDCRVRTAYQGRKRIPTLGTVDNEYRARFTFINGCAEGGETTEVVEGALRLLGQSDGRIELWDPLNHVLLENEGGVLSSDFGGVEAGYTASYRGTLSPPLLEYQAEYVLLDESGEPACIFRLLAEDGHGRYVFE